MEERDSDSSMTESAVVALEVNLPQVRIHSHVSKNDEKRRHVYRISLVSENAGNLQVMFYRHFKK